MVYTCERDVKDQHKQRCTRVRPRAHAPEASIKTVKQIYAYDTKTTTG